MIRVFLIRHGESESNAGLSSDDPGVTPLTALGHRQAEQTAQVFADPPALIVTSSYVRARQSARPTTSRFPDATCQEWPVHEFTYLGSLHGKAMTPAEREPHVRAYWSDADPHHVDGGAESFADFFHRVRDFLNRLGAQTSGPVAVFTHGLFIQAVAWSLLTGAAIADTPDGNGMRTFRSFTRAYPVPNAGVVELRCTDHDTPRLQGGSTLHLPTTLA